MTEHMAKEEQMLFPFIADLADAAARGPARCRGRRSARVEQPDPA